MSKLPPQRMGVTHKAVIHGEPTVCPVCKATIRDGRRKFWVTANRTAEGKICEVFLHMDEAGSNLDGMADALSIVMSLYLQQGGTVEKLVEKLRGQQFEPRGFTEEGAPKRIVTSVVDYLAGWMEKVK
jgi:hypothetical protein